MSSIWLDGVTVACRIIDRKISGSTPGRSTAGQVLNTRVALSPSSIIWYWPYRRESNGSIWVILPIFF